MKIKRTELQASVSAVSPGLSAKAVLDQSDCFAFRGGRVHTFNDEVFCSAPCPLEIEGAVPARKLSVLLERLTEDEVDVTVADGELVVKGKRRKAGIRMEAEIALPLDAVEEPEKWRKVPSGLLDALDVARQCVGTDESQFVLTCVNLAPEWVEGCDCYQLVHCPVKTGLKEAILVRGGSVKAVLGCKPTEAARTENWLHFRNAAGTRVSCRRYAEQYPDLAKYLDVKGRKSKLPEGLDKMVGRAELFADVSGEVNQVTVELWAGGKMTLTGRGPDGWYSEQGKVEWDGEEIEFLIAPKLLVEICRRNREVVVAPKRLMVKTDAWTYVSCTGTVEKKEAE